MEPPRREVRIRVVTSGLLSSLTGRYALLGNACVDGCLLAVAAAREETGLPIVTEVVSPSAVPLVARYADVLQIGSRNMQNYALLKRVGQVGKPVLLKRGFAARRCGIASLAPSRGGSRTTASTVSRCSRNQRSTTAW